MNTSLLYLGRRRIRMVRDIPASTPTPGEDRIDGLIGNRKVFGDISWSWVSDDMLFTSELRDKNFLVKARRRHFYYRK